MNFLPYFGIFIATVVEGDVVYSGAVVMVSLHRLNPFGVLISGSLGGWAGDQCFFYLARGPASVWLSRFSKIARRGRAIQSRVQHHATKLILAVRFLPGLRIAISLACAYAGISPVRFSLLSLISATAWASTIMFAITSLGPRSLSALGLRAWWAPIIPAVLVVLFFRWLSRVNPSEVPSP